jgi:hypothetical protein
MLYEAKVVNRSSVAYRVSRQLTDGTMTIRDFRTIAIMKSPEDEKVIQG